MYRYGTTRIFQTFSRHKHGRLYFADRQTQKKTFKKGELITAPEQIQKELYFVKSGMQMSYFDSDDKNTSLHLRIIRTCDIPESFQFQIPSKYFLTYLTDSELEHITFEELQKLLDQSQ